MAEVESIVIGIGTKGAKETKKDLDGVAASGGNSVIIPNLTAQHKDYLIAKLKDYKSNKIDHPQMSIIAQMLTDEEISAVSEWYSRIKIRIFDPNLILDKPSQ